MAWLWAGHPNLSYTSLDRVDGPFISGNQLTALLGAPTCILFPRAVTAVPIPTPFYCSTPAGYSSLLSPNIFPHPFTLHLLIFSHFTSISIVVLFVPFPFHYHLSFSSHFSFPLFFVSCFHISSFSVLPVLLSYFSSHAPLPWYSTDRLHPNCQLHCYWNIHCLIYFFF